MPVDQIVALTIDTERNRLLHSETADNATVFANKKSKYINKPRFEEKNEELREEGEEDSRLPSILRESEFAKQQMD